MTRPNDQVPHVKNSIATVIGQNKDVPYQRPDESQIMDRSLIAVAALLFAVSPVLAAQPGGMVSDAAMIESWTADQVRRWAVQNSSAANLLDAERRALGCQVDRRDRKKCAQIGLWQAVLREVAIEERNKSGGEALTVYYQIIGLETQLFLLQQADQEFDNLLKLADQAAALAIPGGDSNELSRQQLEIQDKMVQAQFGMRKLRLHLAQLTGQPESVTEVVVLAGPLDLTRIEIDAGAAVAEAIANRGALRAIRTLCRHMNEDTLPSARQMLAALQPGIGLSVANSAKCLSDKLRSLCGICSEDEDDLSARRRQCRQLERNTEATIREQVLQAHLNVDQAVNRRHLADQTATLSQRAVDERTMAVDLDQAPVGSDRLEKLSSLKADGESIQRLVDIAEAEVALRESIGALID